MFAGRYSYLESEWCRKELASFVEAGGPSAREGRVFVVHRDEIALERWPPQLRELIGYPFYSKDASTGAAMPLAVPKPDPQEKEYFARLHRLRDQLANQLKKMQAGQAEPATTAANGAPPAAENERATTVFLAEVTGDLYEHREELQSFLTQTGLRVLPTRYYSCAPDAFQEEMDRDLNQAMLFVQLLGPYPSPRTEHLPHGYEDLQSARAVAAGLPILQWRNPALEAESVRDELHREVVFADAVLATDLEEFKRIVGETVRKTVFGETVRKSVTPGDRPETAGESYILLNVAAKDLALADAIVDRMADYDIAFDIVDESMPLADLTESDDYDGLMVVYGECPQQWVQRQVRQCRRIALDKKHRAPQCAIYVGPPQEKDPLRCRPTRFSVIENHDQTRLEAYLATVRQRRASQ